MIDTSTSNSVSRDETLALLESWLRGDPTLTFKQVRKDAGKFGLAVSSHQLEAARRRLGLAGKAPRPVTRRTPQETPMAKDTGSTPLMAFTVNYLRNNSDASFGAIKAAAAEQGLTLAPIVFGNARKLLGMSPKAGAGSQKPSTGAKRGRKPGPKPAASTAAPKAAAAKGGKRKAIDFTNLTDMVADLQNVVGERDRYQHALSQIAAILRQVL